MADIKTCPYCGFTARPLCSNDGRIWKYICNRRKKVFVALVVLTVAAPVLHSTDARPAAAAQLGRKVRVAN